MELNEEVKLRQRVVVQFGARKIYSGLVFKIKEEPPENYIANYILDILDDEELIDIKQQKFWEWMARYYMCNLGEVMQAALPAGFRLKSESVVFLASDYESILQSNELNEVEKRIVAMLEDLKPWRISDIQKNIKDKTIVKDLKGLYNQGIILFDEEVRNSYKPKVEKWIAIASELTVDKLPEILELLERRAKKQFEAFLILAGAMNFRVLQKTLNDTHGVSGGTLQALIKKDLVEIQEIQIDRIDVHKDEVTEYVLTEDQMRVVEKAKQHFDNGQTVLLNGVIGSGKTFVYLELMKLAISNGQQVLYLLPEVAITEVIVGRISQYFRNFAVWYNYFSQQERTEIYNKVKAGDIDVLIGARSAVFAPFKNLGLVIVDEEHEVTFKQFEKRPHYNGKDSALYLSRLHGAKAIIGSATPSFESLKKAKEGQMGYVELNVPFAQNKKVDLKFIVPPIPVKDKKTSIFSLELLKSIQKSLDNGKQVILFQNKKGYVPYISCDVCGYTDQCNNCDISLTYFKYKDLQRCGYCSTQYELSKTCKACGSSTLSMRGYGTERIAEESALVFPTARIFRFDNESIRKKGDFDKIIQNFRDKKLDILVGTQLLGKGIDFQNVGTVGVMDGDAMLKYPDFRSHERAFQLYKQVGGRAGDEFTESDIIIQTQQPDHIVYKHLRENDYLGLFKKEMTERETFGYPPFKKLIYLSVRHKDFKASLAGAGLLFQNLEPWLGSRVSSPFTPSIGRVRNQYIHNLTIKMDPNSDSISKIKEFITEAIYNTTSKQKGLRIDADVDPM
jgi:primosomal protein N' (replication factor Y)